MFYSFCKLTNNFSHIQIFKLKMRHSLLQLPELEAHIQRAVGRAQKHLMQNQTRSWARSVACWNDMKDSLEDAIKIGGNFLASEGKIVEQTEQSPTLTMNRIGRHISKVAYTKVTSNLSPWFHEVNAGDIFSIPVSHGEGRFVANDDVIKKLFENGQVATQYVDLNGDPTMNEDFNPNGSYYAIEGITSPDGRVLGKMGHSERMGRFVSNNIAGNKNQKIFLSGVNYFK